MRLSRYQFHLDPTSDQKTGKTAQELETELATIKAELLETRAQLKGIAKERDGFRAKIDEQGKRLAKLDQVERREAIKVALKEAAGETEYDEEAAIKYVERGYSPETLEADISDALTICKPLAREDSLQDQVAGLAGIGNRDSQLPKKPDSSLATWIKDAGI